MSMTNRKQDTKIFEIASTVADACVASASGSAPESSMNWQQTYDMMLQMRNLLTRNDNIAKLLQAKITQMQLTAGLGGHKQAKGQIITPLQIDPEIDRQLEADGFHFTDFGQFEDSPETTSTMSDSHGGVLYPSGAHWSRPHDQSFNDRDDRAAYTRSDHDPTQMTTHNWDLGIAGATVGTNRIDLSEMFQATEYNLVTASSR
jgi:hypothetical protein